MREKPRSLDDILDNYVPTKPSNLKKAVTIWLPPEYQEMYRTLRFAEIARELIMTALDKRKAQAG